MDFRSLFCSACNGSVLHGIDRYGDARCLRCFYWRVEVRAVPADEIEEEWEDVDEPSETAELDGANEIAAEVCEPDGPAEPAEAEPAPEELDLTEAQIRFRAVRERRRRQQDRLAARTALAMEARDDVA